MSSTSRVTALELEVSKLRALVENMIVPESEDGQAPEPAEAEGRPLSLSVLSEAVKACTRCGISGERTQAVFARGTGACRVMFVGEMPGANEDAQGFPFVGKAGQLLDRMIAAMGFSRDEVYITNAVKCRGDLQRIAPTEVEACRGYLTEQIRLVAPEVIVAMGSWSILALFWPNGPKAKEPLSRGRWRLYGGSIPVMPTWDPGLCLDYPPRITELWEDLRAVLRQLGRPEPEPPKEP